MFISPWLTHTHNKFLIIDYQAYIYRLNVRNIPLPVDVATTIRVNHVAVVIVGVVAVVVQQ